ncbi:uncharacterized protein [Branchiostoma lanceolatum]|uniref:uncharacterized protein n=1 Tax=Branchiostoma lanceolatum TaxID=7740 RepID=UPI003455B944
MAAYVGKSIRITTNDGIYRGVVHSLDVSCSKITLKKVECCVGDEKKQLKGLHHFYGPEMEHLEIMAMEDQLDRNDTEDGGPPLVTKKENPKHLQQLRDYSGVTDRAGGGGYVSDGIVDIMKSNLRRKDNRKRQDGTRGKKSVRFCHDMDDPSGSGRDQKYTVVDSLQGDLYYKAVDHIRQQSIVGLAMQGINIGRKGKICWVQVATKNGIFLFDVLTLGAPCFDAGLGQLIQDESILKVMHDCRNPSDALWHQYGLHVVNVFDTQVADVMVSKIDHGGEFPRYVNGLGACLMEHLALTPEKLHFHRVRLDHKEEDQAIWAERPLPDHLLDAAAKDVMYLRDLRVALMDKLMSEFVMGVDVYLSVRRDSSDKDALKMDTMGHLLPGRFKEVVEQAARKRRQHVEPLDQNGFRENCNGVVDGTVHWSRDIGHDGRKLSKGIGGNVVLPAHTTKEPVPAKEDSSTHLSEHKPEVHEDDQPCTEATPKSTASSRPGPEEDGADVWQQRQSTSPKNTPTLTPAGLEITRHLNKLPKKLLQTHRQDAQGKTAEDSSTDPARTPGHLTESPEDTMPELWSIPPSKSNSMKEKCWMPLTVELPTGTEPSFQLNDGAKADSSLNNPYASSKGKVHNMKGEEVQTCPEPTPPKQPFFCMPKVVGSSTEAASTDADRAGDTASQQQAIQQFTEFCLSENSEQDPRAHPLKAFGGRLVKNPQYLHGWDRGLTVEDKGKPSGPDVVQYSSHSSDDDLPRSSSSNSQPPSSHSSSVTTSPTKNGANGDAHRMTGVQSSSPSFCMGRGALRLNALKSLQRSPIQNNKFVVPKSAGVQQRDKNNGSVNPTSTESAQTAGMAGVGPPSDAKQDGRKAGIGRASALTLRSEMYSELTFPEELHKEQQENGLRSNISKYPFPSDCEVRGIPKPQRGFLRNW